MAKAPPDKHENFPCPTEGCGRTFTTKHGLNLHTTLKHSTEADKAERKSRRTNNGYHACFCPRCGLNLEILNTALQVAAKHS
jgi:hypothetical protein